MRGWHSSLRDRELGGVAADVHEGGEREALGRCPTWAACSRNSSTAHRRTSSQNPIGSG